MGIVTVKCAAGLARKLMAPGPWSERLLVSYAVARGHGKFHV
jgi:hypothetical protein